MSIAQALRVLIGCVVVLAAIFMGVAGAGGSSIVSAQADTPTDSGDGNTTVVRHRDPDTADEDSDLEQLRQYLAGRMTNIVVNCTQGAQIGNYDACNELNRSYPEYLDRYVEVTGDTSGAGTDSAEAFADARNNTRQFQNQTQRFRQLHEDYQEARAEDDTERARELAREMRAIEENLSQTRDDLLDSQQAVSNQTNADTSGGSDAVTETTQNVSTTMTRIEEDLFVATTVDLESTATEASFSEPGVFTGQVTAADDTVPTEGTILLITPDRRLPFDVDSDGEFSVDYRPRTTTTGATNVSLRYRPAPESIYLPTTTNTTVDVTQVASSTSIESAPTVTRYGETVSVTGAVTVDDTGVEGVPVMVTLDGEYLGQNTTNTDGQYNVTTKFPPTVAAGEQELTARIGLRGRAVESSLTTEPLTVEATDTELSLTTSETGDSPIQVTGRLETARDDPVANESVYFTVDGQYLQSVTTGPDGRYRAQLDLPDDVDVTQSMTLRAAYDGGGGNLHDAEAETQVGSVLPIAPDWLQNQYLPYVISGVGVLLVVLALYLIFVQQRIRWPWSDARADSEAATEATAEDVSNIMAGNHEEAVSAEQLLNAAHSSQSEAPAQAIEFSYAAVRERFAGVSERAQTHWEFYAELGEVLSEERQEALEQLTELYERATFSGRSASPRDSDAAVSAADRLLSDSPQTDGGTNDD